MSARKVRLWARIAAWPILGLTLGSFAIALAHGVLFSPLGLFMGVGTLPMTGIFLPVAVRGTEPAWLSDDSQVGMLLFDLLALCLVTAFFTETDALLRLTPGFFLLAGALSFLFFAGGLRQKLLPIGLDLLAMFLALVLLFSSPFWAAGLAPATGWTDRMMAVAAVVLAGTAVSRLVRAIQRGVRA